MFLEILNCYPYADIIKADGNSCDTSDYTTDNKYGIQLLNKKDPGIMKDETKGIIFVGLRSKM